MGVFSRLFSRDEREDAREPQSTADARASLSDVAPRPDPSQTSEPAEEEARTAPRLRASAHTIPPLPAAMLQRHAPVSPRKPPQLPPLPPSRKASSAPKPELRSLESDPLVDAAVEALIAPDASANAAVHARSPAPEPANRSESRRRVLLEAVLLQVPSLHRRTLTKLNAAGFGALSQLGSVQPDELSQRAGVDRELAQAIVEHVRRFERERDRFEPNALRGHLQARLRSTLGKLTQLQAEFERAEQEDNRLRKRTVRRARDAALLELERLLAELGEVELFEALRRCPVRQKLERLQRYLQESQPSLGWE